MLNYIKRFLPKVFVAVIMNQDLRKVYLTHSKNKILQNTIKEFDSDDKMLKFLAKVSKHNRLHYFSYLLDSPEQGVIKDLSKLKEKGFDMSVKSINLGGLQLFTATEHVDYYEGFFEEVGDLDFLFSPLALLYFRAQKEALSAEKTTLCVLKHLNTIAILILQGKNALAGAYKFVEDKELGFEEHLSDDLMDFAKLANEKIESLEDYSDEKSESDDFDENEGGIEENSNDKLAETLNALEGVSDEPKAAFDTSLSTDQRQIEELNKFNADMEFCRFIISSIHSFYNDESYNGAFIDEVLIFSDGDLLKSALNFLEGEIFIKPKILKVEVGELMLEMTVKEAL